MTKDNESEIESIFKEVTTSDGLFCQFEDQDGVLLLDIKSSLSVEDFQTISDIIDPYFSQHGELAGLIINSKKFPYWSGAVNRREYISFASQNHHKFKKVALSMGGFFTKFVAMVAKGKVHPEVKIFKYSQIDKALEWILHHNPKKGK
jgi:hypothetical protein